jgi:hypothetical protein
MGTRSLPAVDRTDTPQPCCGEWGVPKTYPQRSPTRTSCASPRHMTLVQAVLGGPRRTTRLPIPSLLGRCSEVPGSRSICRGLQPRSELNSPPDGKAEVLCGAVLDNKNPRFPGIFLLLEPSDGLEPSTPSLPWRFRGVTRVHVRSLPTHLLLQIALFRRLGMRRETSRVSFLMCPFCVRGLLSVLTTESTRFGCER